MSSSYLSDLEHKRIEARVHRDRVTETHVISDIGKGIRRKAEKKTWRVKELIGHGSFGQVRLEVCDNGQDIARERAVKKITLSSATAGNKIYKGSLRAKQYENELKALLEFSKPKYKEMSVFVEFLGWFEDGFDVFLAMEYLRLGDLENNLPASGKLPEEEVKVITKQILDGLEIMHLESFAHRDLKPQNVLVVQGSPNWWIKLADFGLTKKLTESTQFGTQAGTLAYMAPEILDKGGENLEYTHAVDIWALGCITFRLLTGSVPFPSARELFRYCDDPTAFPSEKLFACEASFLSADLMMKLLRARPIDRPTSSGALKHRWLPSDAASLKGSVRSRASTDSERSIVLEETRRHSVDHKVKSAVIDPISIPSEQETSITGYDTATSPALKSVATSATTADNSKLSQEKTLVALHNPGSGLEANEAPYSGHHLIPSLQPEQEKKNKDKIEQLSINDSTTQHNPSAAITQNPTQVKRNQLNIEKTQWQPVSPKIPEFSRISGGFGMDIFDPAIPKSPVSNTTRETDVIPTATQNEQLVSMSLGPATSRNQPFLSQDHYGSMGPKVLKPRHLVGPFSGSKTTFKRIAYIQAEITRVLQELRIRFTQVRGGFSCRLAHLTIQFPNTLFAAGSSDDLTSGGHSSILEFEVFIVRVPILELELAIASVPILVKHGIQFKRISGSEKQFQFVSDKILREIRI